MLVDTPGPNNSQNQAHKNTTYQAIRDDSNNLILYVLNGTQLKTKDDARLLRYAADQIKGESRSGTGFYLSLTKWMSSIRTKKILQKRFYLRKITCPNMESKTRRFFPALHLQR